MISAPVHRLNDSNGMNAGMVHNWWLSGLDEAALIRHKSNPKYSLELGKNSCGIAIPNCGAPFVDSFVSLEYIYGDSCVMYAMSALASMCMGLCV